MSAVSQVKFTPEEKQEVANKIYKLVDSLNTAIADAFKAGVIAHFNVVNGHPFQFVANVYEHQDFPNPTPKPAPAADTQPPIIN